MLRLFLLLSATTSWAASPISHDHDLYGTLKRDARKCLSPVCGGYWFTPVNGVSQALYVSGLESADLDDQDLPRLLVKGHLSPPEPEFQTSTLIVSAVYATKETPTPEAWNYVSTSERYPPHNCLVAPCPNILAQYLNQSKVQEFDRFQFIGFESSYSTAQLEKLTLSPATLEAGVFVPGTDLFPGGYETIFEVKALYECVKGSQNP